MFFSRHLVKERSFYSSRTVEVDKRTERGYTIIFPAVLDLKYRRKQRIEFNHWMFLCNRQKKVIPRRLFDRVLLDELDINISESNNIIRLTSLTHN